MSRTTSFDRQPIEELPQVAPQVPESMSIRERLVKRQLSSSHRPSIIVTCIGLWVAIFLAFTLLIVGTNVARKRNVSEPQRYHKLNGQLYLDLDKKEMVIRDSKDLLSLNIGGAVGESYDIVEASDAKLTISWSDTSSKLTIESKEMKDRTEYKIQWSTESLSSTHDVISMAGAHWYGGAETIYQRWPIENVALPMRPFIAHNLYQAVQERYWLSSKKVAIIVPDEVPLWVQQNNTPSCLIFKAQYKQAVYQNFVDITEVPPFLTYSVIVPPKGQNPSLKDFHLSIINNYYSKPSGLPDKLMMRHPIWSTWATYKKDINRETVLKFAQEIIDHGFNNSQLEIDDKWQTQYGDTTPDTNKFPDFKQTVQELKNKGFRTTVWVHQFVNSESSTGQSRLTKTMLVLPCTASPYTTGTEQVEPAWTSWWDGVGASIDVTNPTTADWWVGRLDKLRQDTGISSYKFDAGEANWLGPCYRLSNGTYPNYYTKIYAQTAAKLGNGIEVRVGARTQHLPIFVRLLDRTTAWGYDNGLKTVVTGSLLFGFLGYPFVLPDMVGGNEYIGTASPELFIRWVQVNTFLPSIQFSIVPWRFGPNVTAITHKMMALREKWMDYMYEVAGQSVKTGAPMVRPMWWEDESETALTADGQFMLGEKLLVAPVMDKNSLSKKVYLPAGMWLSGIDGKLYKGPMLVVQSVPLDKLAYYVKQ